MGKQTRRGFLAVSGAVTAAALIGCAAGAPPNSTYQGTYRSVYAIPGAGENGTFNYSVEQKGKVTGALVDSSNNKAWSFNGIVANNGKFEGTLSDGAQTSPISGTLSKTGGNFELMRSGQPVRGDFQIDGKLTESQSNYQGTYTGTYNVPGLNLSGTNNFTVDSKGNLIGAITRGEETGLMSGTVSNSGTIIISAKFASETLPLAGTIVKTADGTSQGNFTVTKTGNTYAGTFKKATETVKDENGNATEVNPFQGAFRGTYGIPEIAEDGSISFTVDKTGKYTGFLEARGGLVGTVSGSVNAEGLFSGNVTYNNGGAERTLAGRMSKTRISNSDSENGAADARSGNFTITVNGVTRAASFEATIGSNEVNSLYRGTFRNGGVVAGFSPVRATDTGNSFIVGNALTLAYFTIPTGYDVVESFLSIDKQGVVIGGVGLYDIEGRITNDGRFEGIVKRDATTSYRLRGILGRADVTYISAPEQPARVLPGPDGILGNTDDIFKDAIPATEKTTPGFVGTLYATIGGAEYPFEVALLGK